MCLERGITAFQLYSLLVLVLPDGRSYRYALRRGSLQRKF
jgi:hypothetical protein